MDFFYFFFWLEINCFLTKEDWRWHRAWWIQSDLISVNWAAWIIWVACRTSISWWSRTFTIVHTFFWYFFWEEPNNKELGVLPNAKKYLDFVLFNISYGSGNGFGLGLLPSNKLNHVPRPLGWFVQVQSPWQSMKG